jgi:hypothetical protein
VRTVAVIIHRVAGVGYRVNPVDIIDVSVVVVIQPIPRHLEGVLPHVIEQVGVSVINARINHYGDL